MLSSKKIKTNEQQKKKTVVPHHVGPKFGCWSMVER